ncbi:type VII secretion integral membrane protein EccD [Streptomonospora sp. S1-112]|uniref:Type VII secretion integral membrane protein EccD n=1 Tax=Streptomonospora mangrovi TaxID=2883123 RepID=A0A9X3NJJ7_9ACTN|nr:type VII secretion integral membrane protein EccD [Streptomonospora mangrovi]MDA0565009.1 type VII secretion integral membrane protein EccD [Streptomonospora mangrovi]
MTSWSRVTLVGENRRVDAVLPAQEPVGALMPEVLRLLGDRVHNPALPMHLATAAGVHLDTDATLADRGIADGDVLRLVRVDEPVPAPVVHEVPDAVGDVLDGNQGRWNPTAARWSATGAVTALALAVCHLLWQGTGSTTGAAVLATVAVALLGLGWAVAATWREPFGTALAIAGGAVAASTLWTATAAFGWPGWVLWGGLASVVAALATGLGLTTGLGRGGVIGGAVIAAYALVWAGGAALGLELPRIAAAVAVVCVVVLSLILRVAMAMSGLTVLDDRRGSGSPVARSDVMTALAGAHRTMTLATVATAVSAAAAGVWLTRDLGGWTAALAALLAIVVASRSRLFPLILQKVPLMAAALLVVVALATAWADTGGWTLWAAAGVLAACLLIPVVVLTVDQPEHTRARLRRIANRFEAVAVVVLIPVAIGSLGTYERLINTF